MSVKLTTHIEPGYDATNPMANQNLSLLNTSTNEVLSSNIQLEAGQDYTLKCNVKNEGNSLELRAHMEFYFCENEASSYADLIQIGDTLIFKINANETLTQSATKSFTPEDGKTYQFYAIVHAIFDPKPVELDPTDRHIAGQTAFAGELDVQLTLQDGLDEKGNSIGHNPNLYLVDPQNTTINTNNGEGLNVKPGTAYTLKARVVNNGKSTDNVQVTFYTHSNGVLKDPVAVSEIANVGGDGGEYVFSSQEQWIYERGENNLVAICGTISDADQYPYDHMNASDRHVAQHNVKASNN